MGLLTMTLKDYNSDYKQFSIVGLDITQAADFATIDGYHDAMVAGIAGVCLGSVRKAERVYERVYNPQVAPPADSVAQTNIRWKVTFSDNVNGVVDHVWLPTADIRIASGLLLANSQQHDPTAAAWVAFKAAFHQFARSKDGNPVTISQIEYEGN